MFKTEYLPFWNFILSSVVIFSYRLFTLGVISFPTLSGNSSPFHIFIPLQLLDRSSFVPLLMIELGPT